MPDLFPNQPPPTQIPGLSYGPSLQTAHGPAIHTKEPIGPLVWVILESTAGVIFFFVLHRIGLIFAGFAFYHAIRLQAGGSKYGVIAMVYAGLCLAAVAAGWIMRLTGAPV